PFAIHPGQACDICPHRPTHEDAARACLACDFDLALECRVVDAARQEDPGDGRSLVELSAGVFPAGTIGDRCVIRELDLEDIATDRGQAARRVDHDAAPIL